MSLTEAEFRRLFDDNFSALRAYATRRVANPADAEDVVIEVFTVLWRRRNDLPEAPVERRMWLYGIARLTLTNHRRGVARSERLRTRLAAQPGPNVRSSEAGDLHQVSASLDALDCLSESDQELIRLAVWEELSHSEIALVVRTSTANVAVRLHRAKRRLRREFDHLVQEASDSGQEDRGQEDREQEDREQEDSEQARDEVPAALTVDQETKR